MEPTLNTRLGPLHSDRCLLRRARTTTAGIPHGRGLMAQDEDDEDDLDEDDDEDDDDEDDENEHEGEDRPGWSD